MGSAWSALTSPRCVTRRQFGKLMGLMLAGAAGLVAAGRPTWLGTLFSRQETLQDLSLSSLSSMIGQRFRVQTGEGTVLSLTLKAASDLSTRDGECFSITFTGPAVERLSQDTYLFEHSAFGQFPLFIVPAALSRGEQRYVAIINRQSFS